MDGAMDVSLHAAAGHAKSKVKMQRHWFDAAYRLITDKAECNMQMQIGVCFSHLGGMVRGKDAIKTLTEGWLASGPLIEVLLKTKR